MNPIISSFLSITVLIACGFAGAHAAELHLRRECQASAALLTLGDVAEVYAGGDTEKSRLAAIELFPSPSAGQSRTVRLREIQDVLAQRGVDLRRNRLAGASAVKVFGPRENVGVSRPTSSSAIKPAIEARLASYLRQHADHDVAWNVSVEVTVELSHALSGKEIAGVSGGNSPWIGSQRFVVSLNDGGTTRSIPVIAQVTRPVGVVVPVRPLARGEIVLASDVQLQSGTGAVATANAISNIDQIIGHEATRPLPAGRALQQSDLRPPLLVTRGAIVTVFARSRGIQVRTSAKAIEDGARDDLIKVQSLLDRDDEFIARVVGYKEVEVFAGPPRIESPARHNAQIDSDPHDTNRLGTTQRPSLFGLRVQGDQRD